MYFYFLKKEYKKKIREINKIYYFFLNEWLQ